MNDGDSKDSDLDMEIGSISLWIILIERAQREGHSSKLDENAIAFLRYQERFYDVLESLSKENLSANEFKERFKETLADDVVLVMQAFFDAGFSSDAVRHYLFRGFNDAMEIYTSNSPQN